MGRALRIGVAAALATALVSTASAQTTSTSPSSSHTGDRWNVVYPVLAWMPLFGMSATLPPVPPCVGCPPVPPSGSGTTPGLSGAWVGGVRMEFGRFDVLANYNYAGLTASAAQPFFHADAKFNVGAAMGGVRVWGPLFVEGGARYQGMRTTITVEAFPPVDWSPHRWAPAVGGTYRQRLRGRWYLYSHIDWSGLGIDAVSMINGEARLEWRPWSYLAITGGYGFGRFTFDGDIRSQPIHTSQTMHGPIVGVGIPFAFRR